jgi:hypothetical protein
MTMPQKMNLPLIFVLLGLLSLTNAQTSSSDGETTSGLVLNVGYGVFVIVFGLFIGIIICLFARASSSPGLVIFVGTALPILLLIIFVASPKEADKQAQGPVYEKKVDQFFIPRFVCLAIFIVGFVSSVVCLSLIRCMNYLVAYRVDSQVANFGKAKPSDLNLTNPNNTTLDINSPHHFLVNPNVDPMVANQGRTGIQPFEIERGQRGDQEEQTGLIRRKQ